MLKKLSKTLKDAKERARFECQWVPSLTYENPQSNYGGENFLKSRNMMNVKGLKRRSLHVGVIGNQKVLYKRVLQRKKGLYQRMHFHLR